MSPRWILPAALCVAALGAVGWAHTCSSDGDADGRAIPDLQERQEPERVVAKMRAFTCVSRVVFDTAPDKPHRLEVLYVLPDRMRMNLQLEGARASDRTLDYRHGERVYQVGQKAVRSTEAEGPTRDQRLRHFELRRATLLWSDGFDWTPAQDDGVVRTAPLATTTAEGERRAIGSLRATLDAEGRAKTVAVLDPEGAEQERLVIGSWQTVNKRAWPLEMALFVGADRVWEERVDRIVVGGDYLDHFFLPPDRRRTDTPAAVGAPLVRHLDLIGITYRLHVLEEGTGWAAALEQARALIRAVSKELAREGLTPDTTPHFELARDGSPRQVMLRLSERRSEPPAGWTTVAGRLGLVTRVAGFPAVDRARVSSLERAVPAGARAGTAYARVDERAAGPQITIYLPYSPR